MKIVIDISDERKAQYLIDILKDIPYINSIQVKEERKKGKPDFNSVFGIWKDKNITLEEIRKKAWAKTEK
ncbi:MAG: hypothetical protein DSY59_02380 [Persephonella sp.]|nr:MAG: hypothetical protein DSY60_04380 [Persephonella sp.]RUM60888.1 MAG: hypothetical protein DSY59_02380 [Persephonella sp.]